MDDRELNRTVNRIYKKMGGQYEGGRGNGRVVWENQPFNEMINLVGTTKNYRFVLGYAMKIEGFIIFDGIFEGARTIVWIETIISHFRTNFEDMMEIRIKQIIGEDDWTSYNDEIHYLLISDWFRFYLRDENATRFGRLNLFLNHFNFGENHKHRLDKVERYLADPPGQYVRIPMDKACAICQQDFQRGEEASIRRLNCGHTFHIYCINDWFRSRGRIQYCPQCRTNSRQKRLIREREEIERSLWPFLL